MMNYCVYLHTSPTNKYYEGKYKNFKWKYF